MTLKSRAAALSLVTLRSKIQRLLLQARGSKEDSWRLIENRQMERGAGLGRYPVRGSFGTRPTGTRSCRGRGTDRSRPGGRTCGWQRNTGTGVRRAKAAV